jgi:hypothetical protein
LWLDTTDGEIRLCQQSLFRVHPLIGPFSLRRPRIRRGWVFLSSPVVQRSPPFFRTHARFILIPPPAAVRFRCGVRLWWTWRL